MTTNSKLCSVYTADIKISGDMYYSEKSDVLIVPFLSQKKSLCFINIKSIRGTEFLFQQETFKLTHEFFVVLADLVCQVMENILKSQYSENEFAEFVAHVRSLCTLRTYNEQINGWEDSFDFC